MKELNGLGASPGRYGGKARVLKKPDDLQSLERGEVMVCEQTTPEWVVGFLTAGAIVTSTGGVTSHAAVVAREMNFPCVVGVKDALKVIQTGDYVEVDGATGRVTVIPRRGSRT